MRCMLCVVVRKRSLRVGEWMFWFKSMCAPRSLKLLITLIVVFVVLHKCFRNLVLVVSQVENSMDFCVATMAPKSLRYPWVYSMAVMRLVRWFGPVAKASRSSARPLGVTFRCVDPSIQGG